MKKNSDPRYKLEAMGRTFPRLTQGEYEANTLIGLMWKVFYNRAWNLLHGYGWSDR